MAALLLALGLIIDLALHGWLGAILEVAALFLALAIAVNFAVYGWLGALGAWSSKEARAGDRLAHLLIAGTFTLLAAGVWYALSFEVRPFEYPGTLREYELPRTPFHVLLGCIGVRRRFFGRPWGHKGLYDRSAAAARGEGRGQLP